MTHIFRYIGIETTTHCNSKCVICPRSTSYSYPFKVMDMNLFKKIIYDIRDNHQLKFFCNIGGMGDSSCDPLLIERLRFVKKEAPGLKFGLSSNMAAWKKSYTDIVINEKLASQLRFSLLAHTETGSEKIYGDKKQSLQACNAIDYFIHRNENAGHPINLELYTLAIDGVEPDIEIIKDLYWDKVDGFEVWKPHAWSNLFPHLRGRTKASQPCKSIDGFEHPLIGINGDVIPCSMDINYTLSLGSLKEKTLQQILASENLKRLQKLNSDGNIQTLSTCKGCVYLNIEDSETLLESKVNTTRILRQ